MKNLIERLRQRLITVPRPGSKPFQPSPLGFYQSTTTGAAHKPGDPAGVFSILNYGCGPQMMQEHVYAVDPLCEEAAKALELLTGDIDALHEAICAEHDR